MLTTILIGFVAGLLGRFLMPGRDAAGFIVTTLLGIAGAVVAGFIGRAVGWYEPGQPAGLLAAALGAVIILALYRSMRGRRTTV